MLQANPAATKVDQQLAAAQTRFQHDQERAELLARTRRFKSSWIELGEALTRCQKSQQFTRWGFSSFEEYCRKELRLKTVTVNKLVGAFGFLKKSEPAVLQRDGVESPFPSIEGVGFLRRAVEAAEVGTVSPDLLSEVRKAVIDENAQVGRVRKQFGELLFPSLDVEVSKNMRAEVLRIAGRLVTLLEQLPQEQPEARMAVSSASAAVEGLIRSLS